MPPSEPLIMPGDFALVGDVRWRVGSVHCLSGERYYMLLNPEDDRNVALMPADVVRPADEDHGPRESS